MHVLLFLSCLLHIAYAQETCPIVTLSEDRRLDHRYLTIATFNVRWLFAQGFSNSPWGISFPTTAEEHVNNVADHILALNADIVNLCEVQDCTILSLLTQSSALLSAGYRFFLVKGKDSSTLQDVALLTKVDPISNLVRFEDRQDYPIPNSQCGWNTPDDTGISKHFIAKFVVNDITINMLSLHLKAFPTDKKSCGQREAQALVAKKLIQNAWTEGEAIILGDMNDWDPEYPDVKNNQPTSNVLRTLRSAGLKTIAENIPQNNRFSYGRTPSEQSMIDHVLISPRLFNAASSVFIQTNTSTEYENTVSDHYPVVIILDLEIYNPATTNRYSILVIIALAIIGIIS